MTKPLIQYLRNCVQCFRIFGRPFVKRFALYSYRSVVCPVCLSCLSCLSVCDVGVLWPIGWTDQDESWHAGRPRPWPHCVRWGLTFSSPKGAQSPQFSAHACCGQTAAWIKMPLGTTVDLSPDDIVLDGDPAPPSPKGGRAPPQFSAHVYCGQTAGWIKVALGMEMGLGPGHIVLDGDTAPLPKRGGRAPQIFGPSLLWPNGWMD